MKPILVLIFMFTLSGSPDIDEVRAKYRKAILSEPETVSALKALEGVQKNEPLLYAYKGALTALLAKHAYNPYTKLEKVKEASGILNEAVGTAPGNIEIRYLRYSIELNLPSFLPYRQHIKQDEANITGALTQKTDGLDPAIRKEIIAYMLKNAQLEPETKKLLETLTR